jgi:hypothetical protein
VKQPHPTFNTIDGILKFAALVFALNAGLFGTGAIAFQGMEIIASNSSSYIPDCDWQRQKNLCLGGAVLAVSGFLGSGLSKIMLAACLEDK